MGKSLKLDADAYLVKEEKPVFEYKAIMVQPPDTEKPSEKPARPATKRSASEKDSEDIIKFNKKQYVAMNGTGDGTSEISLPVTTRTPDIIGVISSDQPNVVLPKPQTSILKPGLKQGISPATKQVSTSTVTLSNSPISTADLSFSVTPQVNTNAALGQPHIVATATADVATSLAITSTVQSNTSTTESVVLPASLSSSGPTQRLVMHNGQLFLIESDGTETEGQPVKLEGDAEIYEPEGQSMDDTLTVVTQEDQSTIDASSIQYQTEDGQLLDHNGQVIGHVLQDENGQRYVQTPEGLVLLQSDDQLQADGGQSIPLETVQALLAMEGETGVQVNPAL